LGGGVTSLAAGLFGVLMALLSVVQCSLCSSMPQLGLGAVDCNGLSCQRNTIGHIVEQSGSRRHICMFDEAGGLRENVNDRAVHLSGLAFVVAVLEM
jgi:hypothetical protein